MYNISVIIYQFIISEAIIKSTFFELFAGTDNKISDHASIQMTMRYAHPTPENKRNAVDVLARIISEESQKPEVVRPNEEVGFDLKDKFTSSSSSN